MIKITLSKKDSKGKVIRSVTTGPARLAKATVKATGKYVGRTVKHKAVQVSNGAKHVAGKVKISRKPNPYKGITSQEELDELLFNGKVLGLGGYDAETYRGKGVGRKDVVFGMPKVEAKVEMTEEDVNEEPVSEKEMEEFFKTSMKGDAEFAEEEEAVTDDIPVKEFEGMEKLLNNDKVKEAIKDSLENLSSTAGEPREPQSEEEMVAYFTKVAEGYREDMTPEEMEELFAEGREAAMNETVLEKGEAAPKTEGRPFYEQIKKKQEEKESDEEEKEENPNPLDDIIDKIETDIEVDHTKNYTLEEMEGMTKRVLKTILDKRRLDEASDKKLYTAHDNLDKLKGAVMRTNPETKNNEK
jgi:hypothetical protein